MAFALSLSAAFLHPVSAAASCLRPLLPADALASAPTAFVGSVQSVTGQGRVAEVLVESVWKGEGVGRRVIVDGRQTASAFTSVDRTFEVGARMLFFPTGARSPYTDNSCSPTTAFDTRVAALEPAGATAPAPADAPAPAAGSAGPPAGLAVAVSAAALLLTAFLVRARRRRHRDQRSGD